MSEKYEKQPEMMKLKRSKPKLKQDYDLNLNRKHSKVNMNHLLNFSFPERQQIPEQKFHKKKQAGPYLKERFVNANFQFVMKPDYQLQFLTDPDILVNWEDVVQMIIPTNKPLTCPICLAPPCAPQVTKCGHVYCWPCLQHYLSLSEKNWRKCPICFESIYPKALKNVLVVEKDLYENATPNNQVEMDFRLMKREKNFNIALPTTLYNKWDKTVPSVEFESAISYVKIMLATVQYLRQINERNQKQLLDLKEQILQEDAGDYRPLFIDLCLTQIKVSLDLLQDQIKEIDQQDYPKKKNKKCEEDGESFYFYQLGDGQHYYLHPLDIKVLKYEFGEYSQFPTHLKLPIVSLRESTVTADLRKRCKYLSHLPLNCDVVFCEADLTDIVSSTTLSVFNNELSKRTTMLLKETERKKEKTVIPMFEDYIPRPIQTFDYDENDFVPLSSSFQSSSPTNPPTPHKKSFADITSQPNSFKESNNGWKLEIPDDLLTNLVIENQTGGKKKKPKKIVLIGNNGGRRGY
ncbi:RING finger protein 10 [Boothiomyces sp. JEL0866]|nr:RING finger protein 10 [Boothiomyces sp. JEL0866]